MRTTVAAETSERSLRWRRCIIRLSRHTMDAAHLLRLCRSRYRAEDAPRHLRRASRHGRRPLTASVGRKERPRRWLRPGRWCSQAHQRGPNCLFAGRRKANMRQAHTCARPLQEEHSRCWPSRHSARVVLPSRHTSRRVLAAARFRTHPVRAPDQPAPGRYRRGAWRQLQNRGPASVVPRGRGRRADDRKRGKALASPYLGGTPPSTRKHSRASRTSSGLAATALHTQPRGWAGDPSTLMNPGSSMVLDVAPRPFAQCVAGELTDRTA
jgi:hypothetical protein